jgi:hypothetical protein
MSVPTDQLSEGIRDLDHRLGARLDSPERAFREMRDEFSKSSREMRDQFNTALREIRDEFSKQREAFVVFRTRVNNIVAIASSVLLLSAGLIIMGILTYQYERGRTETLIANQTASMERLEKRFDELRPISERLDRLSQENARIQGRLDREGAPASKQ